MTTFTERKEIFKSTRVTQALKRSLDTDGTWRTIHSKAIGTPSPPPPENTFYTYYKADGLLYSMDSTGTETEIGGGGAAAEALLLAQNVQTSGLIEGGIISIATATTIDITSGAGYIAHYTDPENPNTVTINFAAVNNHTPAGDGSFIAGFNDTGTFVEIPILTLDNQARRDNILVGGYVVSGGNIIVIDTAPLNLGYDGTQSAKDFIRDVIGPATISGNIFSANGANLSVNNLGGSIYILASNFRINVEIPDEPLIPLANAFTFLPAHRDAGSGLTDGTPTTFIDPTQWDDGSGTLQSVPANDWTIQVGYIAPSGNYVFAFGQGSPFNSQILAETAVIDGTYDYEERAPLTDFVRRCFLVVKGNATDLSNTSQATFIADGKFRGGGVNVTGGIPGINTPGGPNESVQFNDSGAFGGDSDLSWDKTEKSLEIGGTLQTSSENIDDTVWTAIGNGFLTDLVTPSIIRLTSSRFVLSDNAANTITVYDFDGTDWVQVGNSLVVISMGRPASAPLTPNSFAFIDDTNDVLQKYEFDGTDITTDGNALDLSPITAKPIMTALGENRIAFVEGSAILRVYDFDGDDWTQVGNDFNVMASGFTDMAALGTNRIAYFELANDLLKTYDFDGTTWTLVGSSFSIDLGANGMTSLSTSEIIIANQANNNAYKFSFDGSDWTLIDQFVISALVLPSLATLDTNRFVVAKETTSPTLGMQVWQFAKPVNTAIDAIDRQLTGTSESGFRRVDRMEIDKSLYIGNDPTGLPSLMVKGKSQFGDRIDVFKDIRFRDGTTQDTSAQPAENLVIVLEENDFGAVVGDHHVLTTNTIYEIRVQSLEMFFGIQIPTGANVEIRGAGFITNEIDYKPVVSGSDEALFLGADFGDLYIHDLAIKFTTADTELYNLNIGTSFRAHNIKLDALENGVLGKLEEIPIFTMTNSDFRNFDAGLVLKNMDGFVDNFFMSTKPAGVAGTSYFFITSDQPATTEISNGIADVKSNESFIEIIGASFAADSSVRVSGIDLSNLTPGPFFDITGFDQTDPRVITIGNFDVKDSSVTGESFLEGNTAVTVSDAIDAWTIVNGNLTWTHESEERLDGDIDGDVTVTSKQPVSLTLSGNVKLRPASGGPDILSVKYAKIDAEDRVVTFDNTTNTILETATPRTDGDIITFFDSGGILPIEIHPFKIFYVVSAGVNDFQIAYTSGGSAITFTSDGSGTNNYSLATLIGSRIEKEIAFTDAKDILPQAQVVAGTDDVIVLVVTNTDSATDNIVVEEVYSAIHK